MKKDKILYIVIGLLILVIGYLYFTRRAYPLVVPTSSLTPDPQEEGFCKTSDLETLVTFEVAAGTTYATPTMKNIGSKPCTFDPKNYIDLRYDLRNVQNVTIVKKGTPDETLSTIEPGQTLYSLLTYPNGAQCGGETKAINIQYVYRISKASEVTFKGKEEKPTIQVCTSNEKTEVTVSPLSKETITP
jgi:hypothetical protein